MYSMKDYSEKLILVTGASSGIGNTVAVYLAKQGYKVLATVRKNSDAERLNDLIISNLRPLSPLDLTKPDQIQSAIKTINDQIKNNELPSLYAIINIAGGGHIAPIELMNISHFREELEKRLVGPIILLQGLLPLLRHSNGKVIWIATPGLFPVANVADIHAPDYAVNYLARTLNLELRSDGIKNILIRCGGIKTDSLDRTEVNIVKKIRENIKDETLVERISIYENRLNSLEKDLKVFWEKRTSPEKVAKVILKALASKKPKTRYQVGYMSRLGNFLEMLPQSWVDFIMGKRED